MSIRLRLSSYPVVPTPHPKMNIGMCTVNEKYRISNLCVHTVCSNWFEKNQFMCPQSLENNHNMATGFVDNKGYGNLIVAYLDTKSARTGPESVQTTTQAVSFKPL